MPIGIKDYNNLKEKRPKSNKELLDHMEAESAYTTTDIEKFLEIQHPAALSRLKRLNSQGFVEKKIIGKQHYWRKLKPWPEEVKPIQVVDHMAPSGVSTVTDITELNSNDLKKD